MTGSSRTFSWLFMVRKPSILRSFVAFPVIGHYDRWLEVGIRQFQGGEVHLWLLAMHRGSLPHSTTGDLQMGGGGNCLHSSLCGFQVAFGRLLCDMGCWTGWGPWSDLSPIVLKNRKNNNINDLRMGASLVHWGTEFRCRQVVSECISWSYWHCVDGFL